MESTSDEPVEPVRVDDEATYVSIPCWTRDANGWCLGERRVRALPPEDHADAAEDDESLSVTNTWQTIAGHGLQVGEEVQRIAVQMAPSEAGLLHLAGRCTIWQGHAVFKVLSGQMAATAGDIAQSAGLAWPLVQANDRVNETANGGGFDTVG